MKTGEQTTRAERVIRRISDLRDLCRKLSKAGYEAGLHNRPPPGMVREKTEDFGLAKSTPDAKERTTGNS